MTDAIIECIPNFSEARRPEIVDRIADAITAAGDVVILDRHSDLDHNRSVITFVGGTQAVEDAAFRAIQKAAELIDLSRHTGEHPRIGAADVVPFVPIRNASMADCIELSRRLGKRVGEELRIPVYLYEEAATRPERQNLENIRRGQYEKLRLEIETDPGRTPDFGPNSLGSAGATIIGARQPLIAYNVFLNTTDVTIAQKIARAIRFSSGGFRYIKALGLLVEGKAQVSINFTNFHKSPIFRTLEVIRREAVHFGVTINRTELVGLIPEEALIDSAKWHLQLDQIKPEQVLEYRLDQALVQLAKTTEKTEVKPDFLDELAAATPTPGGGSAAAHTAAAAAALVAMVARLTIGKKKYAEIQEEMLAVIAQAEAWRRKLSDFVVLDAQAFDFIIAARRLSRDSPEEETQRELAIEKATIHAAEMPLQAAQITLQVMEAAVMLASKANINAISDAASAAALASAAITAAGYNVKINLSTYPEHAQTRAMLSEIENILRQAEQFHNQMQALMVTRGGI